MIFGMQFLMDVIVEVKKTQFEKSYCTCYTDKFDAKYNDDQIIIFLEATEGTDLAKHPMVKKFR